MRPVDKGTGTGYDPPTTLRWYRNNKAWKALNALTGATGSPMVISLAQCLDLAWKAVVAANPSDDQRTAKSAIMDKATDIYKMAAGPLATAIGTFCSYCETSIPGLLEVEHVANQANYPTLMTTWENFLLACGPCNNVKRDNPSRAVAAMDPPPPPLDATTSSDQDFYNKIRNVYTWPDSTPETFQHFRIDFQVSPDNGANWESMSYADAANLEQNYLLSQDLNTRVVRANVWHAGALRQNVMVYAVVQPWEQDLVQLCGLNNLGNTGLNTTYDRRLYNRTLAWFTALGLMRALINVNDQQTFLQVWPIIQYSSAATGFWSLWVTLLNQYTDFEGHSLGYWLYSDPNATRFYPGTYTAYIELPQRQ